MRNQNLGRKALYTGRNKRKNGGASDILI
ncbi:hypothetical protein YPPY103_2162, partial [Yersinia pestis PY-103]